MEYWDEASEITQEMWDYLINKTMIKQNPFRGAIPLRTNQMDERDVKLVEDLERVKTELEGMKAEPLRYDARAISVAITYLETAQLWFANSRKQ